MANSTEKYSDFIDQYPVNVVNNYAFSIKPHIVLAAALISNNHTDALLDIASILEPGCFIIVEEMKKVDLSLLNGTDLIHCGTQVVNFKSYMLLRKKFIQRETIIVRITDKSFEWLNELKKFLPELGNDKRILLVNQGEDCSGKYQ